MTISYHISTQDTFRFNEYHIKHSKDGKNRIRILRLLYLILCSLGAVFAYVVGLLFLLPVFIGVGLLLCLLAPRLILREVKRKINENIAKGEPMGLYGDVELKIEPEGLHVTHPKGNAFLKWSGIKSITESATDTFFYLGSRDALFFPHSAFAANAEREQFVETARRYREAAVGLAL